MKQVVVKGHSLTAKEMYEVKGGYQQVGKDPHNWKFCPHCGREYSDDELEKVRYDPATDLYGRFCMICGGFQEEE